MPELPEVETIRRDLSAYLLDQTIKTVTIFSPKTVSPSAGFLVKNLVGRRIKQIQRRGKLLIFYLSPAKTTTSDYLLIHLKMTGQLIYLNRRTKVAGGHSLNSRSKISGNSFAASVGGELPNKHTRVLISFRTGGRLFFNDLRKFGYVKLVSATELARLLAANYGPEPLTAAFSLPFFQGLLKHKTTKIKALLLNQKLIAGLGNIYADEVCWCAKVLPWRKVSSLKEADVKKLFTCIQNVIKVAVKNRGTTFNNFLDDDGKKGGHYQFLKVYERDGEKCKRCKTIIKKTRHAGRGTHYCPGCQK